MTTERDALDVETFMRQDLTLGENLGCVATHLGPRRVRAKFVPVDERGSLTASIGRGAFDAWREDGSLPARPNRRFAV